MITKISKSVLFIASYIPLYLIILVGNLFDFYQKYQETNSKDSAQIIIESNKVNLIIIIICLIFSIFSFLILIITLKRVKDGSIFKKIQNLKKCNYKINDYILVYIIPFVTMTIDSYKQLTLFVLIFALLGYICVKNDLVYINPILYFMGYNFYSCNIENDDCILLSKKNISELKEKGWVIDTNTFKLRVHVLSDNIFLV